MNEPTARRDSQQKLAKELPRPRPYSAAICSD
jgi:hypothetical protein